MVLRLRKSTFRTTIFKMSGGRVQGMLRILCDLLVCPERVGTALILHASWRDSGSMGWVGFVGFQVGQCCVDVLPKLLWCAHWRLGAGLVDLGPKEG